MATQADIQRLQAELIRRQGLDAGNSQYMSSNQATQLSNQLSAVEATPTVEYKAPTNVNLNTGMGSATTAMGLVDNQIKNLEAEKKTADDYLNAQGATGNSFYEKLTSMLGNKPKADTQGVLSDQQAKYGIDDQLNTLKGQNLKVAGLQGDIQKLETEEMTAIDRAEGRVASRGAIEGEKETITRDYNIKKAYKYAELYAEAAVATAMSGNLNESRNLVQDAVNAYTYDIEQKISQFDEMFSITSSWVSALDTKEQNLLQAKRTELQAEADQLKQDKTAIGNLMIEYNQYGAGIKLTDTLEEAQAKASNATEVLRARELAQQEAELSYQNQMNALDLQLKQAQINNENSQINKNVATSRTTDTTGNDKTISTIDSLLTNKAISSTVGPNFFARFGFGSLTGANQSFISSVEQIVSQLSLDKLIEAKKQGATFGALSDREMNILAGAATKIAGWQIIKNGKVVGYNIDENSFKKELQVIKEMAEKDKQSKQSNYLDVIDSIFSQNNNPYAQSGY